MTFESFDRSRRSAIVRNVHSVPRRPRASACSRRNVITLVDVLVERQAELLGARAQVVAGHGAGKRLVLHPLDHRRAPRGRARSSIGRTSAPPSRSRPSRRRQTASSRAGSRAARRSSWRATESRASPTRDSRAGAVPRSRGTDDRRRSDTARSRSRAADATMPHSSSFSPNRAGIAADRGLDRQRVLAQALALRPLGQQRPGRVA